MISDASRDLQINEKIDLNKVLIYYGCPQYDEVILTLDAQFRGVTHFDGWARTYLGPTIRSGRTRRSNSAAEI